ncbi:MAG: bifunctional diguanylate cyclase/phosphodiesterase [Thiogranum sp.]|nr:bifunctional diguanylate cyclase/phosphodiesterase [Thiogranum sp.]
MIGLAINKTQRRELLDHLDRELATARHHGERLALLVVNLCRFRQINIAFGHDAGDRVLEQVYVRMRDALRKDDLLFHVGNDEFAVLLTRLRTPQVTKLAVEKILNSIGANMDIDSQTLAVTAVAGAAVFPDHAGNRNDLLKAADSALHFARDQQLDYSIYDASTRSEDTRLASLKGNLRTALDNGDLMLHYQPQLNLQRGVLCGSEALARWHHAEMGWIRPDIFIAVAEKAGLIDSLTYWSLNVALREWSQFCSSCEATSVAINLSAKLLHSPELVPMVERAMNIWNADPASIVLEVTESAMMADPATALHTLRALHEMGITLSIDDFGTGYSSLAYLKKLPVAELKIDKSFVMHMAENRQDRKIVQSVIDLAHTLEMQVVAEGIEDERILNMLVAMGCDYGQGFYIARPMPAGELRPWAEASVWGVPAGADACEVAKS